MLTLKTIKSKITSVLNAIPVDEIDRSRYAEKIKKYSTECGCSMGAVFLFASAGGFIYWFLVHEGWKSGHVMISYAWQGALFVFFSALLGKLAGIGIARIKLVRLYYSLKHKYHVNMYKMD